ncbi:MAG: tRNA (adenosine(37)-N6)-threonylcarbamoyltransferase complex ATPase subunit type 1 TsaE [Clostridia bacterium]|nr:tRNA (adenosine(37)-N6)-threonylcarbamoyltransferase complex ATPase subunit type 1 TsaE [Clostridia bacterium]
MLEFGQLIGNNLRPGHLIYLVGRLGAGKTTLVQGIAQGLEVKGYITSPSFTLVKEYQGRIPLYHMDVYRLDDPEEFLDLGFDEYIHGDGAAVIEWADRIEHIIMEEFLRIEFIVDANDVRILHMKVEGKEHLELVKELKKNACFGGG